MSNGFHPWKHDDRELAARVERTLKLEEAVPGHPLGRELRLEGPGPIPRDRQVQLAL